MAITLFLSEFDVQVIHRNVQWVNTRSGKGTFLIFLGTLMISDSLFQIIASVLSVIIGCIYVYIGRQEGKSESASAENKYADNENVAEDL